MLPPYDDLPARSWWRSVPRRRSRHIGDPDGDPLDLWTIQSEQAYRTLTEYGVLNGDPDLAEPDVRAAYAWMQARADERLPTHGTGVLWLYARTARAAFVEHARMNPGSVVLKVRMPRTHVLLSDYGAWHSVLNRTLTVVPLPGEDEDTWWARAESLIDAWHRRLGASGADPSRPITWPADLRAEAETSWLTILEPRHWPRAATVQGVVHRIEAAQVVRAVRIRTRAARPPARVTTLVSGSGRRRPRR